MLNKKMYALGSTRSEIRELFEYGKILSRKIGKENVYDYTLGNPTEKCPDSVNDYMVELIKNDNQVHSYTSAQGDETARQSICDYNNKKYNFNLDKDLIYLTCGAAASIRITLTAIISDVNDEVIVFAPYFPEYKVFIECSGAKIITVPANEKDFSLNLGKLKEYVSKNTRAVIIDSPNNPTGVVYSEEEIKRLSEILTECESITEEPIYLITDEPYREILFDGVTCPFIPKYYDNTVICYSYSKALSLAGERIGYIAVSPKIKNHNELYCAICGAGRSLGYVCAPSLFQKMLAKCAGETSNSEVYKENRDLLMSILQKYNFEFVKPQGAFYLFVKSPLPNANEFSNKAKEYGLLVVPSTSFGVEGYLRFATCVDKQTVIGSEKAIKQIAKDFKLIK